MTDAYKLNADGTAAVATDTYWSEDMSKCPRGTKVQLLGEGGAAVYSQYYGDTFWVGWCPVPRRAPSKLPNAPTKPLGTTPEGKLKELGDDLKARGYDLDRLERDSPYFVNTDNL